MRHSSTLLLAGATLAIVALVAEPRGEGTHTLYNALPRAALVLAALLFSWGCVLFCIKLAPRRVILIGLAISAVCFVMIPGAAALLHLDPSALGRSAALWPVWMYFCLAGPAIITAGVMRSMPYRPPGRRP